MYSNDLAHQGLLLSVSVWIVLGRKTWMGRDEGTVGFLIPEVDLSLAGTCYF